MPAAAAPVFAPNPVSAPAPSSAASSQAEKKSKKYYNVVTADDIKEEEKQINAEITSSVTHLYEKYQNRVRVPGFVSAAPTPRLGRVVGPKTRETIIRPGDTIQIQWDGTPIPKAGERFSTYTPAIALQSILDPTEFRIVNMPDSFDNIPSYWRMAGYFYEANCRVKVARVRNSRIEALVEQMSGNGLVGDGVMALTPLVENIKPVTGGLQLSAAVVAGSPHDRLSTTKRSYLYLNRGSRDGITPGRVFEAIESVPVEDNGGAALPEASAGEAMVVFASDAFSTAVITKQFDVIRIGSLLRTKQDIGRVTPKAPFEGYNPDGTPPSRTPKKQVDDLSEVPNIENLGPESSDTSLPELPSAKENASLEKGSDKNPAKQAKGKKALSELDALEGGLQLKGLSPEEKQKLSKLSRQEKLKAEGLTEEEESAGKDDEGTPAGPAVENSFKKGKKDLGKKKKKKAKSNEEEELNLLMQQN